MTDGATGAGPENETAAPEAATIGSIIDALVEEVVFLRREHEAIVSLLLAMNGYQEES